MKNTILSILNLLVVFCLSNLLDLQASRVTAETLNKMPLAFTKNMGQWDERVLFRANAGGATMWFTREGVTYQFIRRIEMNGADPLSIMDSRLPGKDVEPGSVEQLVITAKFVGANPSPEVVCEGLMEYKCNYFMGNDPAKWHTDVPNYEGFTLKGVYTGIDVRFSGYGSGQATYEFVVAPGANSGQIKVEYEGAEGNSLSPDGRMILKTKLGGLIAPFRASSNGTLYGTATLSQLSENVTTFSFDGSRRQSLGSLAVSLSYSTYLGGSDWDSGLDIDVDDFGCAYVTGGTYSSDFPTQTPYDSVSNGHWDAFVTKMSPEGTSLVYSTYFGGPDGDNCHGIAVDAQGCAYVTGWTESSQFPKRCATYGYLHGQSDAFVSMLSPAGNELVYSTYLGGQDHDYGSDIKVDDSGCAYVTGQTSSFDFPTLNALDSSYNGNGYPDVFVTKFPPSSCWPPMFPLYSTYLGGIGEDYGSAIAIDESGCAFVTGSTTSPDFPTQSSFDPIYSGSIDAFVSKLSESGSSLSYSTYLGGSGIDEGFGIAVDADDCAYLTGRTLSANFPTANAFDSSFNGAWDVFVAKFSTSGSSLLYSTYLGGVGMDQGYAVGIDTTDCITVTGSTNLSNFPMQNAFDSIYNGGYDAFVTKFSATGGSLIFSTFLGGSDDDWGNGLAIDDVGDGYVIGQTYSSDFPTQNALDASLNGEYDVLVTKLEAGATTNPFRLVLDSLVIQRQEESWHTSADSVPPIQYGSILQLHGRALDSQGQGVATASIEVFDGVSYKHALSDSGLFQIETSSDGHFVYTATQLPSELQIGDLYPFWFASGDAAIPILVPYAGECTELSCVAGFLPDIWSEFEQAPESTVVGLLDDPVITQHYPNYPPYAEDLTSNLNDQFFAGFAIFYSGITNRLFLSNGGDCWLSRGIHRVGQQRNSLASELHDLTSAKSTISGIFFIRENGFWRRLSAEEQLRWDWGKVDWVGIGISTGVCAIGLAAGAGAPLCWGLVVSVAAEINKQTVVPWVCNQNVRNRLSEKCREEGALTTDGVALIADAMNPFGVPHSAMQMANYFKISKNPLKKARWAAELMSRGKRYYDVGFYFDRVTGYYFMRDEKGKGLAVSGNAIDDIVATDLGGGELDSLSIMSIASTPVGTEIGLTVDISGAGGNEQLSITARPLRGLIIPETTAPASPRLSIATVDDSLTYDWSSISHDSLKYQVTIPFTQLPGYQSGQIYRAELHVSGPDIFSNSSADSTPCAFGMCTPDGASLLAPDGSGITIPANSVASPVFVSATSFQVSTCRTCDSGRDTSPLLISTNALLVQPDTLKLNVPAEITMEVSGYFENVAIQSGLPLAVGRRLTTDSTWEILPTVLDTVKSQLHAQSTMLGVFAIFVDTAQSFICGDADGSGAVNISDVVYLINYIFAGGPGPNPVLAGDADCTGAINISDAVSLINYIFGGGAAPCAACP